MIKTGYFAQKIPCFRVFIRLDYLYVCDKIYVVDSAHTEETGQMYFIGQPI